MTKRFFWINHLLIPLFIFVCTALIIEWFRLDIKLADTIYAFDKQQWNLKNSFIFKTLLHDQLKIVLICGLLLFCLIVLIRYKRNKSIKADSFLISSIIISSSTVTLIKRLTHVSCPWHIAHYGGNLPYESTFKQILAENLTTHCFPAGHASGGYALIALYYYMRVTRPSLRWIGLCIALLLGITMDFAQQLRGAHFFSHGLWTLAITWVISSFLYYLFFHIYHDKSTTIQNRTV